MNILPLRPAALLLATFLPIAAHAGTRLVYVAERGPPEVYEIADNGDARAQISPGRLLIVKGNEAFLVEERLTGTLVTRLADIEAVPRPQRRSYDSGPLPEIAGFSARGRVAVGGREGRAFYPNMIGGEVAPEAIAVISDDPALDAVKAPLQRLFLTILRVAAADDEMPPAIIGWQKAIAGVLREGVPLQYGEAKLQSVVEVAIASFDLPAEPESSAAARARVAREVAERGDVIAPIGIGLAETLFSDGRLWLLADDGELSSLAEGEQKRSTHQLGAPVLDLCTGPAGLVAVTGRRDGGAGWTVKRQVQGEWREAATVRRRGDHFLALSCAGNEMMVLTSRRLISIAGAKRREVRLAVELPEASRAVQHRAGGQLFVGLDAGEWGGGLRRIDIATGRVELLERNAGGDLCGGPLNTECDPVTAIVPIPWRPECVAVAVGSLHLMARGRIVSVCPDGIETLYSVAREDPRAISNRAEDRADAVAFLGVEVKDGALLATGHDGLYRITAAGVANVQPWPRFVEVDKVLVSFALPDVVLAMSGFFREPSSVHDARTAPR